MFLLKRNVQFYFKSANDAKQDVYYVFKLFFSI